MTRGQSLSRLCEIMDRLLAPDGCPWDREQTLDTLRPFLVEETYEVLDAMGPGDATNHCEELGDLLMQVVFQAALRQRAGGFDIDTVVAGICDKLVRRHPHVFAARGRASAAGGRMPGAAADEARRSNADAQLQHWEELKRAERAARGDSDVSALAGIARGLPEWQRAVKLQHRAAKVGFDWPDPAPVLEKLHEEIEEVRAEFAAVAANPGDPAARDRLEDEIGDILFVCANLARHAKVDFGAALRRANHKFERRFRAMEALAEADGGLAGQSLEAQDRYWVRAKQAERGEA